MAVAGLSEQHLFQTTEELAFLRCLEPPMFHPTTEQPDDAVRRRFRRHLEHVMFQAAGTTCC